MAFQHDRGSALGRVHGSEATRRGKPTHCACGEFDRNADLSLRHQPKRKHIIYACPSSSIASCVKPLGSGFCRGPRLHVSPLLLQELMSCALYSLKQGGEQPASQPACIKASADFQLVMQASRPAKPARLAARKPGQAQEAPYLASGFYMAGWPARPRPLEGLRRLQAGPGRPRASFAGRKISSLRDSARARSARERLRAHTGRWHGGWGFAW